MTPIVMRENFLQDPQGKTFTDVLNDPVQPFDLVLEFFADASRQQRMEASELHHDRAPLAGVVRELEAEPAVKEFFTSIHDTRSIRFRQAIGVLVRMIMEQRGWQKTGGRQSIGWIKKTTLFYFTGTRGYSHGNHLYCRKGSSSGSRIPKLHHCRCNTLRDMLP